MGVETWTQEQIDLAISLWKQGVSGSIIGARLGKSRCSVLGKLHRLKLTAPRPTRVQRPNLAQGARKARHRKRLEAVKKQSPFAKLMAEPFTPKPDPVVPLRKSLHDIGDGECRYPCTDEPPHAFCAHPAVPGLPYCEAHARICFVPPQPRRRPSDIPFAIGIAAHVARPRPDTDIHAVLTAFDQLEKVR